MHTIRDESYGSLRLGEEDVPPDRWLKRYHPAFLILIIYVQ